MSCKKSPETKVMNFHTASLPSRITTTWPARRPKARISLQNRMDLLQIFQRQKRLRRSQVPTPCSQVRKHRSLSRLRLVSKQGTSSILQRQRLTRGLLATSERAIWSLVRSKITRELRMCLQSTVDSYRVMINLQKITWQESVGAARSCHHRPLSIVQLFRAWTSLMMKV